MSGIADGAPGTTFSTDLRNAPAGATVAAGIRVYPAQTMLTAFSTDNIEETPSPTDPTLSTYTATLTRPSVVSDADEDGPRYAVIFTVDGVEQPPDDFWVVGYAPGADVTPTLDEVSALMHEYVQREGGHTDTSFGADTSPTATQVETIIATQAPLVLIRFGDLSDTSLVCPAPGPDTIRQAVRTLIAQRVAAVVGLSYRANDTVGNDSPEEFWRRIVTLDTDEVVAAARECRLGGIAPGGDGDGGGGLALAPTFQFNTGPRIGTREF